MSPSPTSGVTLKSIEQNLARDLSNLGDVSDVGDTDFSPTAPSSTSAYALLVARGPIECLVAQYFLER